jgi:hypothetical protein
MRSHHLRVQERAGEASPRVQPDLSSTSSATITYRKSSVQPRFRAVLYRRTSLIQPGLKSARPQRFKLVIILLKTDTVHCSEYSSGSVVDSDPNFHVDADPDPDPDWHQKNADPRPQYKFSFFLP